MNLVTGSYQGDKTMKRALTIATLACSVLFIGAIEISEATGVGTIHPGLVSTMDSDPCFLIDPPRSGIS